jgi:hypothetical protein
MLNSQPPIHAAPFPPGAYWPRIYAAKSVKLRVYNEELICAMGCVPIFLICSQIYAARPTRGGLLVLLGCQILSLLITDALLDVWPKYSA